jgi:glycine hydroxymethyltransferase
MNVVAAAAIAFKKAAGPDFTAYARQVLANAATLAAVLMQNGCNLVTGGTTNHLVVVDTIKSSGMDGAEAEKALDEIGITVNKQLVPDDTRPPLHPSGIRLGTPACTTRGMREAEMMQIGNAIARVVRRDVADKASLREELRELARAHPII